MIRSQLISKLNLLRATNLVLLNQRCLQRSALCCAKPIKKRYRAPTEIGDQQIEETHFPKNDSLLDLGKVLRDKQEKSQKFAKKFDKKSAKPTYDRERSEQNRRPARTPREDSTDPAIRSLFIDDSRNRDNYPNRLKLEGRFIINDVIEFGYPKLVRLYYSEESSLDKINLDKVLEQGVEPMKVDYELIRRYSDLVTPQGLVATVELQVDELFRLNSERDREQIPLIVVTSNMRNPGPLVRLSLACGVRKFLSLKRSALLLKGKVVRSSCGSIFRLPFVDDLNYTDLETHLPANATIYLADSSIKEKDYSYLEHVDEREQFGEEASVDESAASETAEDIETVNYLDVNYFDSPDRCNVLIVNGERIISPGLRQFIASKNGKRLDIPLASDVESLNSGVAASIMISEIRRQFAISSKQTNTS